MLSCVGELDCRRRLADELAADYLVVAIVSQGRGLGRLQLELIDAGDGRIAGNAQCEVGGPVDRLAGQMASIVTRLRVPGYSSTHQQRLVLQQGTLRASAPRH